MLLEDLPDDSPFQSSISEILKASMRARDLVNQILSFSRQDNIEPKALRLHIIAKEVSKLIRALLPSTIKIQQNLKSDCPRSHTQRCVPSLCIMNLATNAFHAMEETGGILKIDLTQEKVKSKRDDYFTLLKHETYICLSVSDTGTGMEADVRDRIFNPYFTTKIKGKGTGLGLSVVHGIVERYNGYIEVESQPEVGTTFKVFFPCMTETQAPELSHKIKSIQGGTEKILLVDDEAPIVSMVKQQLERMGYQVTARTASLEALEIFRNQPDFFDLVITDLTMPNMTGDHLTLEIKRLRSDIPVILCTGFSDKINPEIAVAMGIDAYIFKPVVKQDIDAAIRKVLI